MSGVNINYFCGGGFVSQAMENILGGVDLAVNHDGEAILMHHRNHPNTQSMRADVFDVKLRDWLAGRTILSAWFSPDCKHFSRAKGGQLRDQKVRGLAWVVCRVAGLPEHQRPRVIFVENVPEFKSWAPLTRKGKIDKRHIDSNGLGSYLRKWVSNLRQLGYQVEWRVMKACDYGDPTIRRRLFVVARCDGLPIVWPRQSHAETPFTRQDGTEVQPWRTAASIIDWDVPSQSIFERKHDLAEATCRRIAAGLVRYVIDNPDPFIVQVNHAEPGRFRGQSLDQPIGSITQQNGRALVTPFVSYAQHGGSNRSMGDPLHTICASSKDHNCIVVPVIDRQFGTSRGADIDAPLGSVMTQGSGKSALISAFIAQHNTGVIGRDARAPLSTIVQRGTTQNPVVVKMERRADHSDAVSAFLIEYYGNGKPRDLKDPIGTVTSKDRFALISSVLSDFSIVDIGMRMLTNRELARAMSVPDSFDLCEDALTKTSITAKIGNGVPRLTVEALLDANAAMYARAVSRDEEVA